MGPPCHAILFFQSSWLLHESVAPSSAADQLHISLPAWRAGSSPIPPSRVDPISLGVQAPSRFFISYNVSEIWPTARLYCLILDSPKINLYNPLQQINLSIIHMYSVGQGCGAETIFSRSGSGSDFQKVSAPAPAPEPAPAPT